MFVTLLNVRTGREKRESYEVIGGDLLVLVQVLRKNTAFSI